MRHAIITFFLFMSLLSFSQKDKLYENYLTAAMNGATTQNFVVITYKDLNTGEIREVCTEGDRIVAAVREENNFDYPDSDHKVYKIIEENKNRYFEFKNKKAIEILDVVYSDEELRKLKSEIDFPKLANEIKSNTNWKKKLEFKPMRIYAHLLFNQGILTYTNGCIDDGTLRVGSPF